MLAVFTCVSRNEQDSEALEASDGDNETLVLDQTGQVFGASLQQYFHPDFTHLLCDLQFCVSFEALSDRHNNYEVALQVRGGLQ